MPNERHKEIRRRRTRKRKYAVLKRRSEQANPSEKAAIAAKLRGLTPGAEILIDRWELEERV